MRTKIYLSILCLFTQTYCKSKNIPEPYASIITLPANWHGWFAKENKRNLKELIVKYKPKCIVELGSWLGSSTAFMAALLRQGGVLYAIDDWTASDDAFIQKDPAVKNLLPLLYQQFLSNIKHANLCDKVIPVRMKTLEAARSLNIAPDFIYVDASHDEISVYKDVIAWYPKLKKGGIMCGDDWQFESVKKALNKASKELGISIKVNGPFWYFYPFKR